MDFDSVYKKHYTELYYFAIKQNRLPAEAADVLQDTFTEFYKQLKSGQDIENPRAWLFKVLLNTLKTKRRLNIAREQKKIKFASGVQITVDPDSEFLAKERNEILEACINQLSAEDKNLLLLYHKGFSYKEISEILNINFTSVGTTISRATKKLKTVLNAQYHELFK